MRFINKLKAVLGNSKISDTQTVLDTTETIIETINQRPLAVSEYNVLYAGLNELGGYYFFQTVTVGAFNVKTKKGAKLHVIGSNFKLELNSDAFELESDPTDVKGRSITKIDFQIEEQDASKMNPSSLEQFTLSCKNQDLVFSVIESNDEEE